MSSPVRVQLLGPVRASVGGSPVALRGRSARTVLARLALVGGSRVSIDQLADALWGDHPPAEPSVSLRSTISRLRSQLGREVIVTDGVGYRLDVAFVDVDLADVEAGLASDDARDAAPDHLAALLALWDGEALSDVARTPAFEPERARIAELRAGLVDRFHDAVIRGGRAERSLADLERDAAAAPLRESTQLLLMRALHAVGRTADALRVGEAYRRRMVDQSGLDPSPAYDALVRSLVAGEQRPSAPAVDRGRAPPRHRSARTWIPPDTPFVGRERECAELAGLVRARRLVSIVGPGGVGKTRLVTEHVNRSGGVERSPDVVALATLAPTSAVDAAVAAALGLETSGTDVLDALIEHLSATPSLLVLDNCEHVLASARVLVGALLRSVGDLHIVTTSRRRLGLPDEVLLDIGPLEVPNQHEADSPAVQLFVDRVGRCAPRLEIDDHDLLVVADICRLVDGLPLALELAAARFPMFGLHGLRQRLLRGLALPGSRVADDDRRQATIDATVDWSLALLGPDARACFDDVCIFPSWFDLEGLERVSGPGTVLEPLAEIVDSSLVVIDRDRPAYRLLEPVRQVGWRHLREHQRRAVTDRYLDWVAELVNHVGQRWAEDRRFEAHQVVITHRDDLRSALDHLAGRGDAVTHGHHARILSRVLVDRPDDELIERCRAELGPSVDGQIARCTLAWYRGDPDASLAIAHDLAETVAPGTPDWTELHWSVLPAHLYRGDADAAASAAVIAVSGPGGFDSMRSESIALWALAVLYQGRPREAARILRDQRSIVRASTSGGFVTYTRAEIATATEPAAVVGLLDAAARESAAAGSTFTLRVVEVAQLAAFVGSGRIDEASELARRLLPELLRAGIHPQAWTALRQVADLLGQRDRPDLGLLVLASADASERATAVVGDAAHRERQLRSAFDALAGTRRASPAPLPIGELWETVEPVLAGPHVAG